MRKKLHSVLISASAAHRKRARLAFQNIDLSEGQPKVLAHLYFHEGCPQMELAEKCGVEPATMTALLRSMGNRDLIKKKTVHVSGGKRAFGIYLTERGNEMAFAAIEIIDQVDAISFKGFSEKEKDKLVEMLQRIAENLMGQ